MLTLTHCAVRVCPHCCSLTHFCPQHKTQLDRDALHLHVNALLFSPPPSAAAIYSALSVHDFAYNLDVIRSLALPSVAILSAKYIVAWPLVYHTLNGIRHLVRLRALFFIWSRVRASSCLF